MVDVTRVPGAAPEPFFFFFFFSLAMNYIWGACEIEDKTGFLGYLVCRGMSKGMETSRIEKLETALGDSGGVKLRAAEFRESRASSMQRRFVRVASCALLGRRAYV